MTIEIYIANTNELSSFAESLCIQVLDKDEFSRCNRFVFERDRRTFAVAHALLRCVLSKRAVTHPEQWQFGNERFGRPFVLHPTLKSYSFNISHSGDVVAVALCPAPFQIGVDIEMIDERQVSETAAACFCSDTELKLLGSLKRRTEFVSTYFRLWTLKESFLKALGIGIGDYLRNIECRFLPASVHLSSNISLDLHVSCWQADTVCQSIVAISIIGPRKITVSPVVKHWNSQNFIETLDQRKGR